MQPSGIAVLPVPLQAMKPIPYRVVFVSVGYKRDTVANRPFAAYQHLGVHGEPHAQLVVVASRPFNWLELRIRCVPWRGSDFFNNLRELIFSDHPFQIRMVQQSQRHVFLAVFKPTSRSTYKFCSPIVFLFGGSPTWG